MPIPDRRTAVSRDGDAVAVAIALVLPAVVAWIYFFWLQAETSVVQRSAYALGKATQFALPLVWWLAVRRCWPRFRLAPAQDMWGVRNGLLFGAVVFVATLLAYNLWLEPAGYFDASGQVIQRRMLGFGVNTLGAYVGLTVFYSLIHSFLEEYYWRWFVFDGLRPFIGLWPAIIVSSVGFTAHHVIVLSVYFGWFSPASMFFSLAVAVGGAAWAWMYHRSGSLAGPWASHLLVDVGIFVVGFDLVRPLLTL